LGVRLDEIMAKVSRGRISGVNGMNAHSARGLLAWAKRLERQTQDPRNEDDPRWLRRQAEKLRRLADKKVVALTHKIRQSKAKGARCLTTRCRRTDTSLAALGRLFAAEREVVSRTGVRLAVP
jgi:hypothetical protein